MPGKQNPSDSSAEENELDSNHEELDTGSNDTEAKSSNANDSENSKKEDRRELLDVVKDAVKSDEDKDQSDDEDGASDGKRKPGKDQKSKGDASSASKAGKSEEADDEDDGRDAFTEDELKALKPSTQKRIKNLNSKLESAHAQIEDYKPHAESYRKIDGFMRQYGITPEESAEAFTIMALVKTNPGQALQRMQQHINTISGYVGETLPADLKQRVEDGTLSEEDAKELSKARATANIERERREALQASNKKSTDERQTAERQASLGTALDKWQANIAGSDPDYQKKHGFLKTQIQALISELGVPENADEMVRYANIAYGIVNKQLGQVIPQNTERKKEKRSIGSRNASGPSPTQTLPPDAPLLDVVRKAAGR